jgi:hypothetical protein
MNFKYFSALFEITHGLIKRIFLHSFYHYKLTLNRNKKNVEKVQRIKSKKRLMCKEVVKGKKYRVLRESLQWWKLLICWQTSLYDPFSLYTVYLEGKRLLIHWRIFDWEKKSANILSNKLSVLRPVIIFKTECAIG